MMNAKCEFHGKMERLVHCMSPSDFPARALGEGNGHVIWADGSTSHHLYLRDHCRCEECFHPITKQRLLNTFEVRCEMLGCG